MPSCRQNARQNYLAKFGWKRFNQNKGPAKGPLFHETLLPVIFYVICIQKLPGVNWIETVQLRDPAWLLKSL